MDEVGPAAVDAKVKRMVTMADNMKPGASRPAVSTVLNNRSAQSVRVSAETRRRILDAVEKRRTPGHPEAC